MPPAFDATAFHPDHLADLRKSGLSDATIEQAGLYTVRPGDIAKITPVLGVMSLLAFPYPGCRGFTRWKVFPTNLKDRAGKSLRYLQAKDSGCHLYSPVLVADTQQALWIVEGEKKALRGCQEGLFCVGMGGLWNWLTDKKLLPALATLSPGREVVICPDSDVWSRRKGKPDLLEAVYRLGEAMEGAGAQVSVCMLPDGPGGTKQGLDDYLMNHSAVDLKALPLLALTDARFTGVVKSLQRRQTTKAQGTTPLNEPYITRGKHMISCQHNALVWLGDHLYPPKIWLDTFQQLITVDGELLTDELVIEFTRRMEASTKIPWRESHIRNALVSLGNRQPRSSLTVWLDGLRWDGQKRIRTFFNQHYGSEVTDYAAACGTVLILSAVARAYQPGCQADVMVVLIGQQGIGKSKGIADLLPETAWYTDDLGGDLHERKSSEGMRGKWIVEFSEFARINRATNDMVKSFISRKTDNYRPSYGRISRDFPRQCIFIGTTNNDTPLQDIENRRFMPIHCPKEMTGIVQAREQLWAEAVARYKSGEPWWVIDPLVKADVKERQEFARQADAWEEILGEQLRGTLQTTLPEVAHVLGILDDRLDRGVQTRLGLIMKTIGFIHKRVRHDGGLRYLWVRE